MVVPQVYNGNAPLIDQCKQMIYTLQISKHGFSTYGLPVLKLKWSLSHNPLISL